MDIRSSALVATLAVTCALVGTEAWTVRAAPATLAQLAVPAPEAQETDDEALAPLREPGGGAAVEGSDKRFELTPPEDRPAEAQNETSPDTTGAPQPVPAPPQVVAPAVPETPPAAPATAANPAAREPAGAVNAAVPVAPRPTIDTGPLMARGQALLGQGDIAGARLFFERAAEQGDGAAMTALGRTYDPLELQQLGVLGLKGDANRAMQWYRSAATAGDASAQQSIGRLSEWIERTR